MLAHHPITGKPIKVMKTETHLYKNKKTMCWLRDYPREQGYRFQRWETIVSSVELAESWNKSFGHYPSAILLTRPTSENLKWLQTKAPRQKTLLFLNKKLMKIYGLEKFSSQKFANVVCLDEMVEMYPHISHKYEEDELESLTVASIGSLFRVHRLFGFTEYELTDSSFTDYTEQLKQHHGMSVGPLKEPEQLWLIQQYYKAPETKRAKEIRKCLDENLKNKYIDKILLLNESDMSNEFPTNTKIEQRILGSRLTYADVIRTIQTEVPADTLVAFANSDIYLDDSWRQVWSLDMDSVFISLLRYEDSKEPKLFGYESPSGAQVPRPDSQDTWCVLSSAVQSRTWDFSTLDFQFGKPGCDNAISLEFLRKKFLVANPCLSLRTIHCHTSEIRNYDPKDVIEKPIFLYLEPTGLHDLKPNQTIESYKKAWPIAESFSRRIHSASEQSLKTFCSMITRQEKMILAHDSENTYSPQLEEQVYQFGNSFTTPNGLVYGYDTLYMGKQPEMRNAWATTSISHMTPCIGVKSVLAAPLPDSISGNLFEYFYHYLSRVFRLKESGYNGEFWMPRDTPRLQEFMQFFKWKEQVMPVIPKDPGIVAYAPETTMLTPRSSSFCYKEDMEALRSMLRPYIASYVNPRKVVIIQDDSFLSSDDVTSIENALETLEYEVSVVYPERSSPAYMLSHMLGSAICITGPGQENLFWLLPRNARVIECMSELTIVCEGAHTAGACSLSYWVVLMARAKQDARRVQLVDKLLATLEAQPVVEVPEEKKPLVILPSGFEGLHSHSGDSLREMVKLWFSLGYVDLEYSKETPYVWLGGLGETLLYDRASYNWLQHTPANYKRMLVGNPDAKEMPRAIQWSFWPRRPILLEDRVMRGLPSYEERTDTLVFYGKIENTVQEGHRTNKLYEACDEFSMPFGAEKGYKYSAEEYLDKLASAKWGLCMAGFGLKCNREIECMALGTVPVVAPDVDMTTYAVPPQEGVHYLRLKSFDPQDALSLLGSKTRDAWTEMSEAAHAWWKANASAEGLWDLSQRLLA